MNNYYKGIDNSNIEKLIEEKVNEIKNDEKFYEHLLSLGFNDELIVSNISLIIDYFADFKVCSKCKNIKECKFDEPFIKKISLKDKNVIFEYDFCKKYKKINKIKNLSNICDISEEYLSRKIDEIDNNDRRKDFVKMLYNIYVKGQSSFAFVESKKGSGATFITSLFYKEIICKHNYSANYVNGPKRFAELSDDIFNNKIKFKQQLENLQNCDFLVINKLSNYNFNEFTRNNILYPILEHRLSNNLTTIITSELNFEDLMTILNVKKSSRDVRFNQIHDLLDSFTKFNISTNIRVY